ncbi:MAG: hypothetical protein GY801_27675, partial [bacterium]|nr:hypothetical protein [bacterium]
MQIYLTEKIGNPELFTGRRNELKFFLDWCEGIKGQFSKSTAILSRRKTGKTALLQRLYNILFHADDQVIPFYYEVVEGKKWAIDFCSDFFLTFLFQYIAFKTRKVEYLGLTARKTFSGSLDIVRQEGMDYLIGLITDAECLVNEKRVDLLWTLVRDAPRKIAETRNERIVQLIDEFQYLNSEIYRDEAGTEIMHDFAAGYMSTAEYRNAPLLVAGSWVGWLRHMLHTMLPSRFRHYEMAPLPEEEALELVFKYSQILKVPVAEEPAYLLAKLSEGNPFYISAFFYSQSSDKDFSSQKGVLRTIEFETLDNQGEVKGAWWEYIAKTFTSVNERNAKQLVLYLSKYRG